MDTTYEIMQIWLPLVAAGLVQASFGLGVSMLTLLSGHLMSEQKSRARLHSLSLSYIFGAAFATLVLLLALRVLVGIMTDAGWLFVEGRVDTIIWWVIIILALVVGVATLLFYYRRGKSGTRLWLPRRAAVYLDERTRATTRSFEAFVLGIGSIVALLIFIIASLLIAAGLTCNIGSVYIGKTILAVTVYLVIATSPLLMLFFSNLSGRKISRFQKWREKNKKFLQVAAGILLLLLGFYLITYKVMGG